MRFSELKNQNKKANEGIWLEYSAGFEVQLRPVGNRDYDRFIQNGLRVNRRSLRRGGQINHEKSEKLSMKAAAKHILVGWKGLEDDDGKALTHSSAKALELFQANYSFYKDILEMASDLQAESDEDEEDELGNS